MPVSVLFEPARLDRLAAVELVEVGPVANVHAAVVLQHLGQAVGVRIEVREASPEAWMGSNPGSDEGQGCDLRCLREAEIEVVVRQDCAERSHWYLRATVCVTDVVHYPPNQTHVLGQAFVDLSLLDA